MKYYLENFGEKMSKELITEILSLSTPKDGLIDIKTFCSNISAL